MTFDQEETMARYGLFGRITAHPGKRDALIEILLESAELVADVPGSEIWIVSTSPDDPDSVWVTEVWRGQEDHAASLSDERIREVIGRARPLIATMGDRVVLEPIAGKGLSPAGL
jgi:quinol monooxygenase YgiN